MVQTARNIPKSKGLQTRRNPRLVQKRCQFCGGIYKGSPQSKYCKKTHAEQASRYRREAMIDALALLLYQFSEHLTADVWGRAFQITEEQARRKSEQCIKANRTGFEYRMMALGYVYDEARKEWRRPALLVPATID